MKYVIYEFHFRGSVHFGSSVLESTEYTFHADTLFSALCQEAVKMGGEALERLVSAVKSDQLFFSDAFPFVGKDYFLPKPVMYVGGGEDESEADAVLKKAYKKMKYIPAGQFAQYRKGEALNAEAPQKLKALGHAQVRTSITIHEGSDNVPFRIGTYQFREGCGLYVICQMEPSLQEFVTELFQALGYAGIGGKRSSGLGRFDVRVVKQLDQNLEGMLKAQKGERYMTLSLSLPREEELETALQGATYQAERRGGFVSSETYADNLVRKRDLTMLSAGSIFTHRFTGDIYDVSAARGGRHPVYRYAKPLFLTI